MPEPIFVHFLGTGGSTPFANAKMPCIGLKFKKDLLLFDMGECAQFSILTAGLHPVRSELTILITHLHADHTIGLPGLLHTLKVSEKQNPVYIVGPTGIRSFFKNISSAFLLDHLPFDVKIFEVQQPTSEVEILEREKYTIWGFPTDHTPNSIGYVFKEKEIPGKFKKDRAEELGIPQSPLRKKLKEGKSIQLPNGRKVQPEEVVGPPREGRKIVYTGDTRPTETTIKNSEKASLLIHDGTFLHDDTEKATKRKHSTIEESISIARKAKVDKLALVHLSPRYKGKKKEVREKIKKLTKGSKKLRETFIPEDGDKMIIKG